MVHKEGPDTRWATAVLILVILLRCRSMATSALFGLRSMGRTSRFWYSPPLHVSIWLYHRRFRPRVRVSVTKTSCGTIAVSLHGSKVIDQGLSDFLNDQDSLLAADPWSSTKRYFITVTSLEPKDRDVAAILPCHAPRFSKNAKE